MAFYDVMKYIDEAGPMGTAAQVRVKVADESRKNTAKFLKEHGIESEKECWYCGREASKDQIVGVSLQKGIVEAARENMFLTLRCCDACREKFVSRARKAARMFWTGMAVGGVGVAGVVIMLLTQGSGPTDWIRAIVLSFLMVILAAVVLGCLLAWIPVKASAGDVKGLRSELDHPGVKKALQDGWRTI